KVQLFASIWRNRMEGVRENPEKYRNPTPANFEEWFLARLHERHSARMAQIYTELEARLRALPLEKAAGALARFKSEREKGIYPEEVYQHLLYGWFREMLQLQGAYLRLAEKGRQGLNVKRKAWESLLALQTKMDPELVLYFTYLESAFPRNLILNQLVN